MTRSEIKSDLRHIPADSIPYLEHSDARCSHTPKVPSQIKVRNAYATRSIESKMPIKQFKKVAFVSEKSSLPDRSRSRQDTHKTLPSESTIEPLFSSEGKNHMSESAVGQKTQMQGS